MSDVAGIVLSGLSVSGLLVGSLAAMNVISELRRLRAKGAPRPWFVIYRKIRGALPTYHTRSTHGLENRIAWLSWDLRWVTAGETVARITQAVPETQELCLELAQPIVLAGTDQLPPVHMESVRFVPRYARPAAYDRAAVRGTLRPVLDGGLMATAEIVVYSDQASAR
jgi:hypothetical protein